MGRAKVLSVVLLAFLSAAVGASVYAAAREAPPAPLGERVVRAERFEVVDSEGKVKAVLGLQTRLARSVRVMDSDGNVLAVPEGATARRGEGARLPYLALMDDAGRTRIEVAFDAKGEPVIRIMDGDGRRVYVVPPVHELKMLGG